MYCSLNLKNEKRTNHFFFKKNLFLKHIFDSHCVKKNKKKQPLLRKPLQQQKNILFCNSFFVLKNMSEKKPWKNTCFDKKP